MAAKRLSTHNSTKVCKIVSDVDDSCAARVSSRMSGKGSPKQDNERLMTDETDD